MDLYLETFDVAVDDAGRGGTIASRWSRRTATGWWSHCPPTLGAMHADQTKVRQALFNLLSQRRQVHRATARSRSSRGASGRRRDWVDVRRHRHRHRHDRGAAGAAVRGVPQADASTTEQVRRDRAGPGDQPAVLPDDGRRHRPSRASRAGLDLHGPAARRRQPPSRGTAAGDDRPRVGPSRRRGRRRSAPARETRRAEPALVLVIDDDPRRATCSARRSTAEGFARAHGRRRRGGAAPGAGVRPAAITLDVLMPGHGRLGGPLGAQGRPRAGRHPGRHADDRRRPASWATSLGASELPDQAGRPRPPGRVLRSTARPTAPRRVLVVEDDAGDP